MKTITLALTGASGMPYAMRLLEMLLGLCKLLLHGLLFLRRIE